MSDGPDAVLDGLSQIAIPPNRPRITLTFAQSIDHSIATARGEQLRLSGEDSMRMTHQLRARHDCILVGIGTILSDDPRLTARYGFSPNPIPVILDSRLRIPLRAAVLQGSRRPIIAASQGLPEDARARIPSEVASVLTVPLTHSGYLNLEALLTGLRNDHGVETLMVEGGARVIQSFLSKKLVDFCIITIAPTFVQGLKPMSGALELERARFLDPNWAVRGTDAVLSGRLEWD